jgi:hypothetical protein
MFDPRQEFINMVTQAKADVIQVIEDRFTKLENTAWEQMPEPYISEKDQARLDGTFDEKFGDAGVANTAVEEVEVEANTSIEETEVSVEVEVEANTSVEDTVEASNTSIEEANTWSETATD